MLWMCAFLFLAGCKEFNNTLFYIKNSTFSQAPGTVVVLSCSLNKERDVAVTCQDDGQWEPNLDNLLCTAGITIIMDSLNYNNIIGLVLV